MKNPDTPYSRYGPRCRLKLLMLGSLLFQTVQMGILPILLAQMLDNLGVSAVMIGFVLAISWGSVLVLGPFVPGLMKRLGNTASFAVAAALTACGLFLLLAVGSIAAIITCTLLAGAGLIIRWIAADTLVIAMSHEDTKGRMIGYHEALMGLGIALGPLAFVVFDLSDVIKLSIIVCVIGLLLLILSQAGAVLRDTQDATGDNVRQFYPLIVIGLCAAFVAGFIENASVALLPLYYDAFGFALSSSVLFVSGFGLGGTVLQPPLGLLSDKMGVRFAQSTCIMATLISCGLLIVLQPPFWAITVLLFFLGGAVGGLNTLAVIEAGTLLQARQIPAAMTAIALVYTLGSVGGPVVAGWLLESEIKSAMMIGFAVSAAVLGIWLFFHKPSRNT